MHPGRVVRIRSYAPMPRIMALHPVGPIGIIELFYHSAKLLRLLPDHIAHLLFGLLLLFISFRIFNSKEFKHLIFI